MAVKLGLSSSGVTKEWQLGRCEILKSRNVATIQQLVMAGIAVEVERGQEGE